MTIEIRDLLADVMDRLPADRRKMVTALTEEYGAGDAGEFLLALVATATPRERRLTRMLLNELERVERE